MLAQTGATLAQLGTFATQVLLTSRFVVFDRSLGGAGVRSLELSLTSLAVMNVAKQVEIMIEKVCKSATSLPRWHTYIIE